MKGYKSWSGIQDMMYGTHVAELETAACIFHFVNCGFQFWLDKYRILGNFHDKYRCMLCFSNRRER